VTNALAPATRQPSCRNRRGAIKSRSETPSGPETRDGSVRILTLCSRHDRERVSLSTPGTRIRARVQTILRDVTSVIEYKYEATIDFSVY